MIRAATARPVEVSMPVAAFRQVLPYPRHRIGFPHGVQTAGIDALSSGLNGQRSAL